MEIVNQIGQFLFIGIIAFVATYLAISLVARQQEQKRKNGNHDNNHQE